MKKILLAVVLFVISFSNAFADFTINTSYWFHDIKAECSDNSCKVYINGEYKKTVDYTMSGDIAMTSIHNKDITYNIITKELKF